jgi:ribosomal protein S18 acetylase RimI-like enzyme
MISCEDWRDASRDEVGGLFDAECARWLGSCGWDYRPACRLLEVARGRRRVPGFLARDLHHHIVGWTCFVLHDGTLHIGNLVARDAAVARTLLRAVLHAPERSQARRLSCFLYPNLPAIETVLARLHFAIERHAYLQRPLSGESAVAMSSGGAGRAGGARLTGPTPFTRPARPDDEQFVLRDWSPQAMPDVIRLFARAYEGMPQARCFAPDGRVEQWDAYLGQLVQTRACGRFEQALSLLAETRAGELAGAALVTAVGDRTAHVAQMAVAPEHRGLGLGECLVLSACQRACNARYDRVTLLVARSNDRAGRLYARLGFESAATFLYADRTGKVEGQSA